MFYFIFEPPNPHCPFHYSSQNSLDIRKDILNSKVSHEDWFDNDETNSNTSIEEENINVDIMAINGVLEKDQTSSNSDTDTSEDVAMQRILIMKGKMFYIISKNKIFFQKVHRRGNS